jgi:hypothetical protein
VVGVRMIKAPHVGAVVAVAVQDLILVPAALVLLAVPTVQSIPAVLAVAGIVEQLVEPEVDLALPVLLVPPPSPHAAVRAVRAALLGTTLSATVL